MTGETVVPLAPGTPLAAGRAAHALAVSRRVLALAWPVIAQNLLETLVVVVDTLLVSRLGAAAIAGVGASIQVVFFLIAVLSAVAIGAGIIVAHAIGAGDRAGAERLGKQALSWGLLASVPLAVVGALAAGPVIRSFGVAPEVALIGAGYLRITMISLPAFLLVFGASAVLRGAGDTKTPLRIAIAANVINAGLAYSLIYGHVGLPALGTDGSAWAAATARIVSAFALVVVLVRGTRGLSLRGSHGWRPQFTVVRRILGLGLPAALEQMLISAAFTVLTAITATLGTDALAAQRIALTAMSVSFLPGIGFSIAASTLVGQSVGARRPVEALSSARASGVWAALWMAALGALLYLFAAPLMALFTSDAAVASTAARALQILALQQPLWGVLFVSSGALRGSGNTRFPLVSNSLGVWSVVIASFVAVRWYAVPLPVLWSFFAPVTVLNVLANVWRFQRGDWRVATIGDGPAAVRPAA